MHARALLSADTFDDVETTTIVAAVLYGIAHAGTSNHNAQNHGRTTRQPSQRTR
jgi:hypothetical protein